MSERMLAAIAAVLAALVLGLAVFWQPAMPERPLPRAGLAAGGDFTVQSATGPVALADFRGKVVLLYFGYTYCPDVCPTSLAATAAGLQQLTPAERSQVAILFISVDPQRDTPARLKEYAEFFDPGMIGATDTPERIAELAGRYGVIYAAQQVATAGQGYVVDHSSDTLIVDPAGQLAGKIAHATPPDQVAAALRNYLKRL